MGASIGDYSYFCCVNKNVLLKLSMYCIHIVIRKSKLLNFSTPFKSIFIIVLYFWYGDKIETNLQYFQNIKEHWKRSSKL